MYESEYAILALLQVTSGKLGLNCTLTGEYDLILVGDLLESCKLPELDGQGQELMHAMQAGSVSAGQALQHPWLTG